MAVLSEHSQEAIDLSEVYKARKYRKCLLEAKRRLRENSRDEVAECYRGACLSKLGHHRSAIEILTGCIARNPDWVFLWVLRGDALCKLERYEDAVSDYWQGVNRDPTNFALKASLGQALCVSGLYELGERYLYEAMEAKESLEPVLSLIYIKFSQGRDAEAESLCRDALATFPGSEEKIERWMIESKKIANEISHTQESNL